MNTDVPLGPSQRQREAQVALALCHNRRQHFVRSSFQSSRGSVVPTVSEINHDGNYGRERLPLHLPTQIQGVGERIRPLDDQRRRIGSSDSRDYFLIVGTL